MKTIRASLVLFFAAASLSCEHEAAVPPASPADTPVYVTIYSHNERTLSRFGGFRESLAGYLEFREGMIFNAKLIASYGLKYNWQSDYVILEAIAQWEKLALEADPSRTNGKHVLRYLAEDLGVSIEVHAHESQNPEPFRFAAPPNYADLARMVWEIAGIEVPPLMGGSTPAERSLEELAQGIAGNVYETTWFPKILSGFAYQAGHGPGADSSLSGVWRPSELSDGGYAVHDDASPVIAIGGGNGFGSFEDSLAYLDELTAKLASGQVPGGRIYTASITFPEDHMLEADLRAEFEAALVRLKALADAGKIVAATHPGVIQAWKDVYGSSPNVYGTR
ncbi:MAG: hypothetical protein HYY17_02855 [Planctomycetes bacterium]|nr:hypothetical protein [Planctomycetota bacterium]